MVKISCRKIEVLISYELNKSRKRSRLKKLHFDKGLQRVARRHSLRMSKKGRIWHGKGVKLASKFVIHTKRKKKRKVRSFWDRIFNFFDNLSFYSYKGYSAENVAMDSSRGKSNKALALAFHRMWMKSIGHYNNRMNYKYQKVGVGVIRKGNKFYATELFYG